MCVPLQRVYSFHPDGYKIRYIRPPKVSISIDRRLELFHLYSCTQIYLINKHSSCFKDNNVSQNYMKWGQAFTTLLYLSQWSHPENHQVIKTVCVSVCFNIFGVRTEKRQFLVTSKQVTLFPRRNRVNKTHINYERVCI